MPSWVRKYLLSRRAASSRAVVVRCRSVAPNEPDQPVAQILSLQQDEDRDDEDDAGGFQWPEDRRQDPLRQLPGGADGRRALGRRRGTGRRRRGRGIGPGRRGLGMGQAAGQAEAVSEGGKAPQRGLPQGFDLVLDRRGIARSITRQLRHLRADKPADQQYGAKGEQHREQRGDDPPQPQPPQEIGQGREHEGAAARPG